MRKSPAESKRSRADSVQVMGRVWVGMWVGVGVEDGRANEQQQEGKRAEQVVPRRRRTSGNNDNRVWRMELVAAVCGKAASSCR